MAGLLLVSHDPRWALETAGGPTAEQAGSPVVLLDAAVAVARASHPLADLVRAAIDRGVVVSVHDEAALRRGMVSGDLVDGVKTVDLDELADMVAAATQAVVWL